MRYIIPLFACMVLGLGACQQQLSPDAQRLVDEERARLAASAVPIDAGSVTMEAYEQIGTGSSYDEAAALLGEGTEVSRSTAGGQDIVIYQWVRSDGGNISLTFNHGALVSKAQAGL